jgi:membrane-associated phospholipid phosphatase
MNLRPSEWITIIYFTYLLCAALAMYWIPRPRRGVIIGASVAVAIAILTISRFGARTVWLRDWIPLVYVLIGYRLPALFVTTTNQRFERTLLAWDHRWFGIRDATEVSKRASGVVIEVLELAYLFCYPMIPAGFACLYTSGLRDEADRFWIAVLLAVFACYGMLPWLPTRPPRAVAGEPARSSVLIRRLNLRVLGVASIQLNTFPSGHAAAAAATALAVGARLPLAGVVLGLLALGIAIGSVVGRYHYAADALAGGVVGIVGFLISQA